VLTATYETYTADYTSIILHAMRPDGQWFRRMKSRGPWGYQWSRWTKESVFDSSAKCPHMRSIRLPKG
jgi:hypothetical protein